MSKAVRLLGWALLSPALLLLVSSPAEAQTDADRKGVENAVLDYVEGVYLADPARIEQSVSPQLTKLGYWRQDSSTDYEESPMTYQQLYDLAARWNASGRIDPDTAPKEIVVFDVLDKTAVAKLTAAWGVDYFQLAKVDDKWMIINVIWQSVD